MLGVSAGRRIRNRRRVNRRLQTTAWRYQEYEDTREVLEYLKTVYCSIHRLYYFGGRRLIGISGSLLWSKTLVELIFNPCGEFRWCPEGPISQIHSPQLQAGDPGIFSDLLRSVQMLKRELGAESNWKLPHLFIPNKTATLVPEFAVEYLWSFEHQLGIL